jgi:dolichol kinase
MKTDRETTRRLVHFAFGGCALLLDDVGRRWGLLIAGAAVVYNAFVAPVFRLDRGYRRESEPRFGGLTCYALAVFLLILMTPLRVAAGAWAVLAAADPVAAVVGTRLPRPRVPWNPRKSLTGALAGAVAGAAACALVLWPDPPQRLIEGALSAGVAGALFETLPLPVNDNLVIAAAAACALWPWVG